ncbi:hypothetical protein TorRG33x02_264680 [Trema orientale]|uniref:Uncharacterized protein n=1 Tax=Trema orientale TaxID=63057 RepID=A0A2P5D2B1_TREOI|nr:hypothetical protein TorRG33x02_264680 [Trema orientale]
MADNSNISMSWFDTPYHQVKSSPSLKDLVTLFSEETRLRIEKLERMETIHNLQSESLSYSIETMTNIVARDAQATYINESHREEPSTSKRILGCFDIDDYSSEQEVEDNAYDSPPFEI